MTTASFTARDHWRTAISLAAPGALLLRGYPLAEVMRNVPFTDGVFLTIRGRLPEARERRMLDALLNALLDHQFVSASVPAARYVASGNPQVVPAAAAGILSAGTNTLSPQDSAEFLVAACKVQQEKAISRDEAAEIAVRARREQKLRVPGLGHPLYKTADPRAEVLWEIAAETGFRGPTVEMVRAVHQAFVRITGKQIALNVDGMMAAIMTEMGFSPRQMVAINLLSYLPGILSHCIEEIEDGVPLRTIPDALADYVGEPLRHVDGEK